MLLVIGATGYVGRYFCLEMASKGIDILALGRSAAVGEFFRKNSVPFQHFDFADRNCFDSLPTKNVDAVIDLSARLAELETPVEEFFTVNTLGVYQTLEFARQAGIPKVVITSSHKVYNDIQKELISEEDAVSFRGDHSPYIISKLAAENFVTYYNKDFGMTGVVLRLTGVHGYGEILGHLEADGSYRKSTFELFFEKALRGEPISVWGDPSVRRDHIYIKDVVSALYAAATSSDTKGIFNIASGVGYTQYEEACVLAKVFGSPGQISIVTREPEKPGLTRSYVYDISKAERELLWRPTYVTLEQMYIDYKREWLSKKYHNYHMIREEQRPATL